MLHYEYYMGLFYLKDNEGHIHYTGEEVAIGYDANPDSPCLHKHGDPEMVSTWLKDTRKLFRSRGLTDVANDLQMITSRHWRVEDLNRMLTHTDTFLKLMEEIMGRASKPPSFDIERNGMDLTFDQDLVATGGNLKGGTIDLVGWKLAPGKDPKQAEKVKCKAIFTSRPYYFNKSRFEDALFLEGGPTGYESFTINPHSLELVALPYWSACAGGSGWPEFRIHGAELMRVLTEYLKARKLLVTISIDEDEWEPEVINIQESQEGGFQLVKGF